MDNDENGSENIIVFRLDGRRYGLRLGAVERVVRTVALARPPEGARDVHGVVNLQGRIVPVLDLRSRLGLTEREPGLHDHLVVTHVSGRTVALPVETVDGVYGCPEHALVGPDKIDPCLGRIDGVVKLADGMVFICDLATFLAAPTGSPAPNAGEKTGDGEAHRA